MAPHCSMVALPGLAEAYERGFETACQKSSYAGAIRLLGGLVTDLDEFAWPVVEVPPRTMAGVLIIAQVADLRSEIEREIGHYSPAPDLSDLAVAALVRISRESALA